ncbi:MAG: hypothetical protein ACOYOS_17925, partial [Syntrophales bacterium]
PTKMELLEVINMGIMQELINEKRREADMDDDSEPSDIADQAYKEWLEARYLETAIRLHIAKRDSPKSNPG